MNIWICQKYINFISCCHCCKDNVKFPLSGFLFIRALSGYYLFLISRILLISNSVFMNPNSKFSYIVNCNIVSNNYCEKSTANLQSRCNSILHKGWLTARLRTTSQHQSSQVYCGNFIQVMILHMKELDILIRTF